MPLKTTRGVSGNREGGGVKGRGATSNLEGRFERVSREVFDDGWSVMSPPPGRTTRELTGVEEAATSSHRREPLDEDALPVLTTQVSRETARSIISRNESPDIPFTQSINPYRGCEHGCSYCMDGSTLVLLANGRWRRLDALRAGDAIIGTQRRGDDRYYVPTTVLAHWATRKPAYRISLADGTTVIASGDHRFMTERGWKHVTSGPTGTQRPHLTGSNSLLGLGLRDVSSINGQAAKSGADLRVLSIEALPGERDLFDITTGTGDFVANGVISHNCYARPSHAYLSLSPGLDFETRLFAKTNAAELLRKEIAKPGYVCSSIALGANTDPYQPIEREWRITRGVLEVLAEFDHPFSIVTKNALVERDIDLIASQAAKGLVRVYVSVTNLDNTLARKLEPRAASPARRIETIRRLTDAGIPVGVMVAPVIPALTDPFLEEILERARDAGASSAGYILLRLPLEVAPIFREWLDTHFPLRAAHVMSIVQQMRGGRDYVATFGERHRGTGVFADLLRARFERATARLGLATDRSHRPLDTTRFRKPGRGEQLSLW